MGTLMSSVISGPESQWVMATRSACASARVGSIVASNECLSVNLALRPLAVLVLVR